ncbi:MAG: STAS/SEC14 domain-containing protein [Cyclobacteriaceae bacterium]
MIKLLELSHDQLLGIRVDRKATEEDMKAIVAIVEEKLEHHEKLKFYIKDKVFDNHSLVQFFKEADYMSNFEKGAIVINRFWLEQVTQINGYLAGIEVRNFEFSEKKEALR